MKINRKLSILSLALLALFGGSFSGMVQRTYAQSDVGTCGTDTDQIQDENGADDASEPQCSEDDESDSEACVLIGATLETDSEAGATNADESDNADTQDEQDTADENTDETDTVDEANVEDGDQVQDPSYTGSITVDEAVLDSMTEAEQCAALVAQATITPEEAQAAAETESGGVVVKVELDNENGFLVYSVEMEDGSDVKVDAGNGSILIVEPAGEAGEEAE